MANRDISRPTWIGESPKPPPRLGILALIGMGLAISFGLFLWFVFPPSPPKTYFAVIEATAYGEDYPKVEPTWSAQLQNRVVGRDKTQPNSKEKVEELLKSIPRPIKAQKNQDTLLLVLRAHAAVDAKGKCTLLIGEEETTQYPIGDFLRNAMGRGYKNTVVIADICDLHYYPRLGYIVNPIAEALQSDCKTIQDELSDQNLWLVCAAADGQRSFHDRKGKTLFQESVLETWNKNQSDQDRKSYGFSLNDFYKDLRVYCENHSQGLQTPILIPAGDSSIDLQISWQDSSGRKWYDPPKPVAEDEKGKAVNDSDSTSVSPLASEDSGKPEEKAPSIWGQVDKLRDTGTEQDLRPFEIDPLQWRLALAVQSLSDADSTMTGDDEIASMLQRYARQMEQYKNDPGKDLVLEVWKSNTPAQLTEDERKQWSRVRKPLRDYLAFVVEWVSWRDLALSFPYPNLSGKQTRGAGATMRTELLDAAKAIGEQRESLNLSYLHSSNDDLFWLGSIKQSSIDLEKARLPLRDSLRKLVDQLLRAKSDRWSWLKEQQLLVLLQCPLLDAEQRRKLVDFLGRNSNAIKTAEPSEPDRPWDSQEAIKDRYAFFTDTMRKLGGDDLPKLDGPAAGQYTRWGQSYKKRYRDDPSVHPLQRWHQLALQDLPADPSKITQPLEFTLFYPGNPKEKRLTLTPRDGEGKWLDLELNASKAVKEKRFKLSASYAVPGQIPGNLKLRWRVQRGDSKPERIVSNGKTADFKVRWEDSKEWKQGEVRSLPSMTTTIVIEPPRDYEGLQLGLPDDRLVFEWLDEQDKVRANDFLPILVNAERLDVVLLPIGQRDPVYPTRDGKLQCTFPAIQDSTFQFDVHIRNKIGKRRSARVIVSEGQPGGPPIARSKIIDWNGYGSVPVEFEPTANPSPDTKTAAPPKIETLVFRVEELEPIAPTTDEKPGASNEPKSLNKAWPFTCVLNPENPGSYVKAEYDRIDISANQAFDLLLQFDKDFWSRVPGVDRVPMIVRWKHADKPDWEEEYATEILPEGTDKKQRKSIPKLPVLKPGDNEILFECDLGGYRRSVSYRLKCNFNDTTRDGKPDLRKEILPRISSPKLKVIVEGSEPVEPTAYSDGNIVFPTWQWSNWENKGMQTQFPTQYKIRGLDFFAADGIDAIGGLIHWQLDERQDEQLKGFFSDRSIVPDQLKWEGTTISFALKIGEAQARIASNLDDSTSTEYPFTICTTKDCDEESWSRTLIFDRKKPKEGKMQGDRTLRGDGNYRLTVEWLNDAEPDHPGGTGISEGYLAMRGPDQLSGPNRDEYDFRSKWKLKTKGRLVDGTKKTMIFDIKAEDLEQLNKELPKGPVRINALILDKAGNFQSKHESLEVDWEPISADGTR